MIRKSCFNLIEILLAVAIIAVGLSSVMGLFTAGIRTGQETVSETNLPDACETILARIRADLVQTGEGGGFGASLSSVAPVVKDEDWDWKKAGDVCNFDLTLLGEDNTDGESIKKDATAGVNGFYLYRQLTKKGSKYVPGFTALVRVRKAPAGGSIVLSNPSGPSGAPWTPAIKDADGDTLSSDPKVTDKCRVRVEVRISYPADLAPEQREFRTFSLEVFNEKYDRSGFEKPEASGGA